MRQRAIQRASARPDEPTLYRSPRRSPLPLPSRDPPDPLPGLHPSARGRTQTDHGTPWLRLRLAAVQPGTSAGAAVVFGLRNDNGPDHGPRRAGRRRLSRL